MAVLSTSAALAIPRRLAVCIVSPPLLKLRPKVMGIPGISMFMHNPETEELYQQAQAFEKRVGKGTLLLYCFKPLFLLSSLHAQTRPP